MRVRIWFVAIMVILAGCASGADTPETTTGDPASSTTVTVAQTSTSTTAEPTTTIPADAVPPELEGVWETESGFYQLTFRGNSYSLNGMPGLVSVNGDEIEFYGHQVCTGRGTYTWVRRKDAVTFTAVNTDPCPRASALDADTYYFLAARS